MGHIPTKTWVKGKKPSFVPVGKIRPTNIAEGDVLKIKYTPILLVRAQHDFYYIVDGNHRFFKRLFTRNKTLEAWVLEEGDQRKLCGDPLPQYVREWKEGIIDLKKLCVMAKTAYENIQSDIDRVLEYWRLTTGYDVKAVVPVEGVGASEERDLRTLTSFRLVNSILKVIKGTTSIEQESFTSKVNLEDLLSLYNCFIDGGIKAIRKRLKVLHKQKGKGSGKQYSLFPKRGPTK